MTAHVVDEFLVFDKYRVMVLDKDTSPGPFNQYRINGDVFAPVQIHSYRNDDSIPLNYIAIKATDSFLKATVEFI